MIREIVLDTETTGMDPFKGDRIIEIGAVELSGHLPTGRTLQFYIHPERDVPADATAVHGITNEFLKGKPIFSQIYTEFLDFIGSDSTLVIHNAEFDMKFLNWELQNVGHPPLPSSRVIDTLAIARKKFPGSPASLDALCRRFGIDNSNRTFHGALLDSELLAEVYLELLGGRQHGFALTIESGKVEKDKGVVVAKRKFREPRDFVLTPAEAELHEVMVGQIKEAVWKKV